MNYSIKQDNGIRKKNSVSIGLFVFLPVIFTVLLYLPVTKFPFVNLDDSMMVIQNLNIRHLNAASIKWMFTALYFGSFAPVAWLSFALDYRLGGLEPWIYHLNNLVLHCLNTVLVFLLSFKILHLALKERGLKADQSKRVRIIQTAFITSLLFGIHPLHVESVAWVADRVDLLCGVFFFASLYFYLNYASEEYQQKRNYALSLIFFTLSIFSKSMAITLPLVLILLDAWPLGRLNSKRLLVIREKVPFLLLSFLLGWLTFLARIKSESIASMNFIPLDYRIMNAFHSLMFYLVKMAVPLNLCALYPIHLKESFSLAYIASAFGVILISVACYLKRKKHPYIASAWIFYCLILTPTLGFIQAGSQAAADRYTYLPSLAPFLLLSAFFVCPSSIVKCTT